jgi:hypothetical protein
VQSYSDKVNENVVIKISIINRKIVNIIFTSFIRKRFFLSSVWEARKYNKENDNEIKLKVITYTYKLANNNLMSSVKKFITNYIKLYKHAVDNGIISNENLLKNLYTLYMQTNENIIITNV